MDVAWYRGPQRSPPPSQRLENFVPGIQAFIEKHGTRINQPGGKLIRVSVEFAYQWPRHGNHRKRGVAQVSRCNIDKWRRLANRDILRLCSVSFVLLSLARLFFPCVVQSLNSRRCKEKPAWRVHPFDTTRWKNRPNETSNVWLSDRFWLNDYYVGGLDRF